MRAKADRLLYICLAAAWAPAIASAFVGLGLLHVAGLHGIIAAMYLFLSVAVCVRLLKLARHGNRDAQLFLLPFFLEPVMKCVSESLYALSAAGMASPQTLVILYHNSHFEITWPQFFSALSCFAVGAVMVLRFTHSARHEQRLRTEMESARSVQEQLVPVELPATDHFQFEAAYRSASEVGGDLYQVYPRADGSVMVLMGDVSGHGLKAAMLGTLLAGSAGTLAQEDLTRLRCSRA